MRLDLQPDGCSELLPFQACCLRALDSCEFSNTYAGVSEDGSLTWIYKGSVLEVINAATGLRVSSLHVAQQLRDEQATVACVCEFRCQGRARLLVGINGAAEQGVVVLLDVASSMVVQAIQVPQHVTCLESVLRYGGSNVPRWALSEQLLQFYGIVAVGTDGGYVYLVDMCLDAPAVLEPLQSVRPLPLLLLNLREKDVAALRKDSLASGRHLALLLGEDEQSHSNDCFHFRRPDLTAVQSFNEDEVQVTSLKYLPQTGSLAIGYSFGGFHLWKLFNPALEYTSAVEQDDLPVAFFVYQEPENDPKNFAYIWVGRDDKMSEMKQESVCSVSLYQLCYSRKTYYASYGSFFEELSAVLLRMEHNLTCEPYNSHNTTTWSSQLIAAYTITDPNYHPPAALTVNDSFEEGCQGPDLSLCAFVWEAQDSNSVTDVYLAIFDMNRWYHSQMPSRIKRIGMMGQECCPYFAVYHLTDIVQQEGYGFLQTIMIKPGSLLRFINTSPMPPEQHFYPSSLAFDAMCVFSHGITSASFLGIQRQVLANLEAAGPGCLVQPADFYHRCIQTGLLPRSPETPTSVSHEEHQRMALLTMALEHGRLRFITACIHSWADGEFVYQGCTLQFLLAWAWDRVTAIKQQIDVTSRPLYDWSGTPVDQRMLQGLHACLCSLAHLKTILHVLLTQSFPVTDQGQTELEHRIQVVTLLHHHLKLVLWFVHNKLLPEHDEAGQSSSSHYIFPSSELTQVFQDRRTQMKKLNSKADTHQLILIDALVHSTGTAISQLWQNEGGSGQYPPPSLHAALSMYLMDSVSENTKNAIMLYLLFDMAAVAHGHQEEFAEKIPLFTKAFDVPLGLVQQIHGFWLIDHMNFEEGLPQLLHQGSCQELGSWQHSCILNALLSQGEIAAAARYLSMHNPPVSTPEDVKTRLSILVASRLVWQAVAYVRYSCGPMQQEDMLKHVFHCCQQRKLMELLFELPLNETEEKCLQTFLSENVDTTSAELLVLHLLQRAQYVPAIRLNDRMRHRATMDLSAKARERSKTRNMIVEGFRHSLPATQQYLINHPPAVAKTPFTRRIEVTRPKPLSTMVTKQLDGRVNSQSSLILAVMDKVAEAEKVMAEEEREEECMEVVTQKEEERVPQAAEVVENDMLAVHNPGPFLCTPTMSRARSRLSMTTNVVYPMVKSVATPGLLASQILSSPMSPQHTRRSKVFTADCMSLLQTPKIDHTPAKPISPLRRTITPHSILKVSSLPRPSPKARVAALRTSPKEQHRKRLGFGDTIKIPSPPPTPKNLSPSSTPTPTSEVPPVLDPSKVRVTSTVPPSPSESTDTPDAASTAVQSASDVATPKHLRFASPEIQEISPPYVSPDSLARPPLRSAPHGSGSSGTGSPKPGETSAQSDEEITFNFSRQQTENAQTDSDSSTLPIATPSPRAASSRTPPKTSPQDKDAAVEKKDLTVADVTDKRRGSKSRPSTPITPRSSPHPSLHQVLVNPITEEDGADEDESKSVSRCSSESSDQASKLYVNTFYTQTEIRIKSGEFSSSQTKVTETKLTIETDDLVPTIEFEEEAPRQQLVNQAALETVEPSVEAVLEEVRKRTVKSDNITEEDADQSTGMVEISDDEVPDLEIQPPTPISTVLTPARDKNQSKTTTRSSRRKDQPSTSSSPEEEEKTEPTPPKLRKVSSSKEDADATPSRRRRGSPKKESGSRGDRESKRRSHESLHVDTGDDEDKNDNRAAASPPASPSRRSSRRSVERSTPERSTRHKSDAAKVESQLTVHTESSSDELMPPPVSPSRRSLRQKTPERSTSRKAQSSKDLTAPGESSDSGIESSRLPDSAASTDTEAAASKVKDKEEEVPKSPSRRSTRRSMTPDITTPAEPLTPTRRSRRHSKTADATQVSPVASPGRGKRRTQSKKDEPSRESVETEASDSPSRRSSRSSWSRETSESRESEAPASPGRKSSRQSRKSERAESVDSVESAPMSPGRRSTRRSVERGTSVDSAESAPVSPGRRSTRRSTERTVSADTEEPAAVSTPTRRSSRGRSKTPDLSPSRYSTRLRSKDSEEGHESNKEVMDISRATEQVRSSRKRQKKEVTQSSSKATEEPEMAEEVQDVAMATEQVRSSRHRQRVVSPRSSIKKNLMSTLDTGSEDSSVFQFAAPTPLTRLQADHTLAPPSEAASFIFSAPLTRSIVQETVSVTVTTSRTQSRKHSAASSEGVPDGSEVPEAEAEESRVEGEEMQQVEEEEEASAATETRSKRSRTTTSRKKRKTGAALPSASPTDSPINLLSPADASGSAVSERGSSLPKRGARRKTGATTTTRVLRKRKAKLW